ncbi:DMT family transporter [Candidatus Woesearchaeota archaeon]|nr:DMT family transporter [Candidatus Woesearchaeota archaeon]
MKQKTIGVLAILAASIMWAIEPIFGKLSYFNSDFLHTSAIRAAFVALIALLYVFITNKGNLKVNGKQFSTIIYVGIVGTVFADLIYFYSFTKIPVVNAVLIGHMQPIFIVLMGFFILKEDKLTKFDYLGILLMIIAGLIITTRTLENLSMLKLGAYGDFLVLLAAIAWATTTIAMRKYLRDMNAGVVVFYRFLIASLLFAIYLLYTSSIAISNIYQILVGVVVGIGTILYYEGLKRLKAAQVGALELSTPFFAAILSFFILGEITTFMQIIGIVLLFVGVYFLSKHEESI